MVRVLLITFLFLSTTVAHVAHAALGGHVVLYSDASVSRCTVTDAGPSVADVYVVHVIRGSFVEFYGAAGIQFRLSSSAGFTGTWLEDVIPAGMSASGVSPSGIGIGYGVGCPTDSPLILHARYQLLGSSSACSFLEAAPYPNLCCIVTRTCFLGDEFPVDGARLVVNPDQNCPCETPLATEPTTWGRIKAMYRN